MFSKNQLATEKFPLCLSYKSHWHVVFDLLSPAGLGYFFLWEYKGVSVLRTKFLRSQTMKLWGIDPGIVQVSSTSNFILLQS